MATRQFHQTIFFISLICITAFFSSAKASDKTDFSLLPLIKNATGHYEISATVNGVEATFIVDTGATGTVIDTNKLSMFDITTKNDAFDAEVKAVLNTAVRKG
jgi:predicted aspartyl protease